jgi:hypothetical protein
MRRFRRVPPNHPLQRARRKRRAAERRRCYDFQCQELVATFSGHHDAVVLGASEEAEPGRSDG